jgi:flagellin-like protein
MARRCDEAASPIVGVILLCAITIALAALVLVSFEPTWVNLIEPFHWPGEQHPWDDPASSHPGAYVDPTGHWCEPTLPGHPLSGFDCHRTIPADAHVPSGIPDERPVT